MTDGTDKTGGALPRRLALGLGVALALPGVAAAQEFPQQRPVRLVVPFIAGGSADVLARITAQALAARWGQPVLVENRAGAGGHLGSEHVARSAPDGHTLGLGAIGIHAAYGIYRSLGYDPGRDLAPVGILAEFPNIIIVHPSVPARNLTEFMTLLRERPGELTFGSAGVGTSTHMAGELFMLVSGLRLTHIPYRGSAQAVNDLVAGQIQVMFENLPTAPPLIRDGRVRPIALTSAQRSPSLPEIPTAEEAGLPGYVATAWFTIFGPSGIPAPLLARLNADLRTVLAEPAVAERFRTLGATPVGGTVEEARAFFASETGKWTRVIQAANIRLD
jgi:tripartite-type tricarboxylate transporter receptor subunit TctC